MSPQQKNAVEDVTLFGKLSRIPAAKRTPNQDAKLAFLKVTIPRSPLCLAVFQAMPAPINNG